MTRIYNSFLKKFKSPFGAVKVGEMIRISILLRKDLNVMYTKLLVFGNDNYQIPVMELIMDKFEHDEFHDVYRLRFAIYKSGRYSYCFQSVTNDGRSFLIKRNWQDNDADILNNGGFHYDLVIHSYQGREVPDWIYGGIMYQIFPDRFNSSGKNIKHIPGRKLKKWHEFPDYLPDEKGKILNNDFYGGDIRGIIDKLDYLEKLSVTAIYLNPISLANENHRYNTGDFKKVDPLLGNEEDLKELCQKAKERGMRIILDGVYSHVGADSKYFNKYQTFGSGGAYNDPSSKFFGWFKFINYPEEYKCWWGHKSLPEIEKNNSDYQNYICEVLEHYLKLGVSGFRLDVADELPNQFLELIRKKVKSVNPEAIIIAEVWEDAILKEAYSERKDYLLGKKVDSVMNYFLRKPLLEYILTDGDEDKRVRGNFYNTLMRIVEQYPKPALHANMNFISTHDVERGISILGGETYHEVGEIWQDRIWQKNRDELTEDQYKLGKKRFKIASLIQFFVPGVPSIYYGDEVGMTGYKDPFNRKPYPWGKEDKELLEFFIELAKTRKANVIFKEGEFRIVHIDNNVFIAERSLGKNTIVMSVNRTEHEVDISNFVRNKNVIFKISKDDDTNVLAPYGGIWVRKR